MSDDMHGSSDSSEINGGQQQRGPEFHWPPTAGHAAAAAPAAGAVESVRRRLSGRRVSRRTTTSLAAVTVLALGAGAGVVGYEVTTGPSAAASSTAAPSPVAPTRWGYGSGGPQDRSPWGTGWAPSGSSGSTGSSGGGATGSTSSGTRSSGTASSAGADGPSDAASIAAKADSFVVDVVSTLNGGEAAGTGIVLTSTGEILTNNHVIEGATSISVRDVANGRSYAATVVGYDRTEDVAVLQLKGASGLATAPIASGTTTTGTKVVAVGNAGGTGGTPSYAGGAIVATGQTITASDEDGGNPETLTSLLETDAAIQAGDSGGPLVDTAGRVVGMDTAASASGGYATAAYTSTTQGYAIPIANALTIARAIVAGQGSSTIHIGATAALGVYVEPTTSSFGSRSAFGSGVAQIPTSGVVVAGVASGSGAAKAGLAAGDTIESVAGVQVATSSALTQEMTRLEAGSSVMVRYLDADGTAHSVRVALGTGTPQ
ncbi:S1-C subfamily serine protease [Motilibacter rhizosphaerae]|uniref:S1-C subfamily serine protease n=1 Tax=Motilibacter rhizosphaerae TaxID=598652 RepID=A0A4Q7NWY8_9ACTN|nr:trypsin-like peptidase domain-containing protein [Motilibacter rhizosphaerae]RZS91717.1 S1-C subfamily serine protease [Motilibacter rhizosphaerae]